MADTLTFAVTSGGAVYAPSISSTAYTLSMPFIAADAQAHGATIGATATAAPTMTVEVWDTENDALLANFPDSYNRRFQDVMSDLGSGQITVDNDDPDLAYLAVDNHIRFKIADQYAFTFTIAERRNTVVDRNEELGQGLMVGGPGIISDLRTATVYPYGGVDALPISDQRPFSWASPEYDSSAWASAVQQYARISTQFNLDPPYHEPWFPPKGWPTPMSVDWIWTRYRAEGVDSQHPPGKVYFRQTVSFPGNTAMFFLSADDRARVFIDGKTVIDWTTQFPEDSFLDCWRAGVPVSAGDHVVAIEAETYAGTSERPRRGMVALAIHDAPTATGVTFSSSTLIAGTDTTWKCLDYPSVIPAPTPGDILITLLNEAQARTAAQGWTWSFTADVDSAGVAWAQPYEFVCRVGDDLVNVLKALAETAIDFHADPVGRRLHAWNKGTSGASAASYGAGSDLRALVHTERV